jgi:signal transduction histidine kinase
MSPRKQATAAFAVAISFLLLSGIAASFSIARLHSTRSWVTHTYEVENALSNVNVVISRAGRLRTEYVDSGDPVFLTEYETAAAQIPKSVQVVRFLIRDNPPQRENCTKLETLANKRIELMQRAIDLKLANESTLEKQAEITRQIVATASLTDVLLEQMQSQERILLNARSISAERVFWWTVLILLSALVVALTLFMINYRLLTAELEARQLAQDSLRTLSARLLRLQDEERRKFARELHDSLGQYLAALKMLMPGIGQHEPDAMLTQCLDIVDKSLVETRTISHLLHPPLLDEAGLKSAANWYVEGFTQRSGVKADLDLPDDLGRLPTQIEIALFRVLQEALTNIHRHANAKRAEIKISLHENQVVLRIRDAGHGMPRRTLEQFWLDALPAGVGLAGMRERIRELGGRFEISSNVGGTVIVATVPLPQPAPSAVPMAS